MPGGAERGAETEAIRLLADTDPDAALRQSLHRYSRMLMITLAFEVRVCVCVCVCPWVCARVCVWSPRPNLIFQYLSQVDRLEVEIRKSYPEFRYIDIEIL